MIIFKKKKHIHRYLLYILLYFFINFIFITINTSPVFADSIEEYQSCIDKECYAILEDNNEIRACLRRCDTRFPTGAQAWGEATRNIGTINIDPSQQSNNSQTQLFTPSIPVGEFKGAMPVNEELLGKYLDAWYKFVVGVVGILSAVIIMWGGFKWLTSRGNSAAISDAKDRIWSAIIGLILVFVSITLLNLINPRLTDISLPNLKNVPGSHGFSSQASSATQTPEVQEPASPLCQNQTNPIIDYSNVAPRNPGVNFPTEMDGWFDQYGQAYGVDPNALRAITAAESNGNPRATSPAGAYGLMQILPSTATAVVGHDSGLSSRPEFSDGQISGTELINNPELSVAIAASFISANQNGLGRADVFAGYNGGYGTNSGSALSQSRDCPTPGTRAYTCCTNPGGLRETQNYVNNTMAFYNYYNQ